MCAGLTQFCLSYESFAHECSVILYKSRREEWNEGHVKESTQRLDV